MRRSIALAAVAALIASVVLAATAAGGGFWKAPPFSSIGIKTVEHIDKSFVQEAADARVLAVWMETGSTSTACLATLNEGIFPEDWAIANGPITIYCAPRDVTIGGTVRHGLFLHMFLAKPIDAIGYFNVNVYQEGAHYYGLPQLCPGLCP